jgi:hypothetical protein
VEHKKIVFSVGHNSRLLSGSIVGHRVNGFHFSFSDEQANIFVVDSSDRDRIAEAKEELRRLKNGALLLVRGKMTYAGALSLP